MDNLIVGILVVLVFAFGWVVSYLGTSWAFKHNRKKMERLGEKLRANDAETTIIWRDGMKGPYVFWVVHFTWFTLTACFAYFAFTGPSDQDISGTIRTVAIMSMAFTALSLACAWVVQVEYSWTMIAVNDKGINQYRWGLRGYRPTVRMSWNEVEKIDHSNEQLSRLVLTGGERAITIYVDSKGVEKLTKILLAKVPKDIFDFGAYSICSIYSD